MKKFVIAAKAENEKSKVISDIITRTFADESGKAKDVVFINLDNIGEDALEKFIAMGGIDCFVFSGKTDPGNKFDVKAKIIANKDNLSKNTYFVNAYDSREEESIQDSQTVDKVILSIVFSF